MFTFSSQLFVYTWLKSQLHVYKIEIQLIVYFLLDNKATEQLSFRIFGIEIEFCPSV